MSAVAHIDDYKAGKFFSEEFRGDMSWNGFEHNVLLRNIGEGDTPRYVDVAMGLGADGQLDARGIAVFDFDNDGDLDIAINHNPGDNERESVGVSLFENEIGAERNWLRVSLQGRTSNRDALGARVTIEADELRATRLVGGSSYASQHDRRIHFGLGDRTAVDRLTVYWPSGLIEQFENLATGESLLIIEGEGIRSGPPIGGSL